MDKLLSRQHPGPMLLRNADQDLKKEKISRILTMKSIRKKNNMSTFEKQLSGISPDIEYPGFP